MTTTWYNAFAIAEFPDTDKLATRLSEWDVLIVRQNGEFVAFNDCCTHQASRLSTGRVRRGAIMCPLHGARFDAASGRCMGGAYPELKKFEVREANGRIEIAIPDEPPRAGEKPVAG